MGGSFDRLVHWEVFATPTVPWGAVASLRFRPRRWIEGLSPRDILHGAVDVFVLPACSWEEFFAPIAARQQELRALLEREEKRRPVVVTVQHPPGADFSRVWVSRGGYPLGAVIIGDYHAQLEPRVFWNVVFSEVQWIAGEL